jgi:hypothetical protein
MAKGTGQKHYQREDHAHAAHPPDAALQDAYDAAKKSEADPIGPCCAGRSSGRGYSKARKKGNKVSATRRHTALGFQTGVGCV